MKFLIDRCAGRRLADWLRERGYDVREAAEVNPDPGDEALLQWAADEGRVLVTIDDDFGRLVFQGRQSHTGLVRLPDVPAGQRISLMKQLLIRYQQELESGAILTVGRERVRISRTPTSKE
jgi:predicted nuclease of predicted toxin-antitoxin system